MVQANKVFAIQSQHGTTISSGHLEHNVVRSLLASFPSFLDRCDVVAKLAKPLDNGEREVLVGIEASHCPSALVVANLLFDFLAVRSHVRPSVGQIFRPQRGITAQNFSVLNTLSTHRLQDPHRYPRADDARFAPAHACRALNSGKRIA